MCGIAGILYKTDKTEGATGKALIDMLDGCQHRGPDSTGFALYNKVEKNHLLLRFFIGDGDDQEAVARRIDAALKKHGAEIVDADIIGNNYRVNVIFTGNVQEFAYGIEHAARVISIGTSLEIIKDIGSAHDVDSRYRIAEYHGSHGIGHVRLATESDVKPEASHPFWATGFTDIAIVHNGQITNYWKMRRRLERRDFTFHTDNDSELVAVYLADKLEQGEKLDSVLETAIDDLDGTFSFLVSTPNEIGYAKDHLAAKPMVLFETDEMIAIASEEVSLNRLFPGQSINSTEPAPGTFQTWSRSI
jgi:glutamate synthase domain-containing protein 1